MILDEKTSFGSCLIDKMCQKPKFMRKNLTNSVNKINFFGRDRAHIRLIPENTLWKNGSEKYSRFWLALVSKLEIGQKLSKFL